MNSVFIIAIGNPKTFQEIRRMLTAAGAMNVIWAFEIYEYHLSHAPKDFSSKIFIQHQAAIEKCFDFLEDDLSREVFLKILEIHTRRMPLPIVVSPMEDQYFPEDLQLSKGHDRLINCGSYTGDTVRELRRRVGKISALACFEPDMNNYALLSRYLSENTGEVADVVISFRCGLYSEEKVLRFSSGNNTNSSFSKEGNHYVQCVSIDHALPEFNPTMINMDIEGAEMEALQGARNTIHRFLPDLAISVYHIPEHVYAIPLLVKEMNSDYRIFIRNYTSYPAETVMYATL